MARKRDGNGGISFLFSERLMIYLVDDQNSRPPAKSQRKL